jgi:hypothetical protein
MKQPILNLDGSPMRSACMSLGSNNGQPYNAAGYQNSYFNHWNAQLFSADTQTNPNRDRITARARELIQNDPWASGALGRLIDGVIGLNYRPIPDPDYRALAFLTNNPAFDASWAHDYKQ